MKNLLITIFAILCIASYAQPDSVLIFDISTIPNGDTVHYYDELGLETQKGQLNVQIRFKDFDCITNIFDAGTSFLIGEPASYPVSYSELEFPILLDTTALRPIPNQAQLLFSRYKVNDEHLWNFMLKFEHDRGYIVYTLGKGVGCSTGQIWRVY